MLSWPTVEKRESWSAPSRPLVDCLKVEEPIKIGTGTDIAIAFEGRFVFDPAKLGGNPRKLLKVSNLMLS